MTILEQFSGYKFKTACVRKVLKKQLGWANFVISSFAKDFISNTADAYRVILVFSRDNDRGKVKLHNVTCIIHDSNSIFNVDESCISNAAKTELINNLKFLVKCCVKKR